MTLLGAEEPLTRRAALASGLGAAACGLVPAWALASDPRDLMPYDRSEVTVILPDVGSDARRPAEEFGRAASRQAERPRADVAAGGAQGRAGGPGARSTVRLTVPPTAYILTAHYTGLPAWLLYGIALQESKMSFGPLALPFPWTLCVAGRPERYGSYMETVAAMQRHLRAGITNIDSGVMQVNWGYHQDKLRSPERALDPYPNLAVGALILRQQFAATGDWAQAVARYHTGGLDTSERRERGARYAASVARQIAAHGLTFAQAAATRFTWSANG